MKIKLKIVHNEFIYLINNHKMNMLSEDIWVEISKYLLPKDINQCTLVCQNLSEVLKRNCIWQPICDSIKDKFMCLCTNPNKHAQFQSYKKFMNGMSKYYTHWNGSKPFEVVVYGNDVFIYKKENAKSYPDICTHILRNNKKIFVGKSPHTSITEMSGGYGDQYDGNTILINTHGNHYTILAYPSIYEFSSICDIVEYISEMGNSDVPYPIAHDALGNLYEFCDNVILPKHISIEDYNKGIHDDKAISHYCNRLRIGSTSSGIKKLLNIKGLYRNNIEYVMPYSNKPIETFANFGPTTYVIDNNDNKIMLTEEMYCSYTKIIEDKNEIKPLILTEL